MKPDTFKRVAFTSFALVSLVFLAPCQTAAIDDLQARLAGLEQTLEEKRQAHHVPGMSIVVVHDGEIVLARGFGVTNLDTNAPVTADTLFMIGSTTKAFTATLAAMMVDAGKIAWDEPLASYLPYFDPQVDSDDPDARITLRDALSHRSGFSRMGPLLVAQDVSPREVLEVAAKAEPYARYHEGFHYNNIMYLAAGTVAAEAAGTDWHKMLQKRIFKPLGMKSSSSIGSKTKGALHPGYSWNDELAKHKQQPVLSIDVGGPAGSIVSNANDMGRWLIFLLDGGKVGDKRLVGQASLGETWKSNVTVAAGVGYGMGWMLREWAGYEFQEHGGNIHGYGAQVGILPAKRLGFALMTNLSSTPLQQESLTLVWEALLGQPERAESGRVPGEPAAADDLSRYVGDYIANFATFQDATFTVSENDGVLFVNVPGQTDYELKPPNEDGLRPFAITDTISVNFEEDEDGNVNMMRMQQGGLNFEIPRKGAEFPAEIDALELAPFVGKYNSEKTFGNEIDVVIQNRRLALDVPGQMVFELRLPDEDGRRSFRIRDVMNVTFDTAEDGSIASLTLRRGDEVIETMPRTGDADGDPLPTLDEIISVRATDERRAAQDAIGAVRASGSIHFVNAGLVGASVELADGERFRSDVDLGKFGWIRTAFVPGHGEMQTHVTPIDSVEGRPLQASRQTRSALSALDWRDEFEKVRLLKRDTVGETPVVVIRVANPGAPAITLYVEPGSGDVLRLDTNQPVPGHNFEIPLSVYLDDYREFEGVRVPFKTTTENPETGHTVTRVETLEAHLAVCDELFTLADDGDCR